MIVNLNN